jgi:uncharacterized protein
MSVFEWDPAKNAANISKHQIDFSDAARIFEGSVLERVDARRDYGEDRYTAIGEAAGRELFVVYTIRAGNRRIISARKANRDEREAYRKARGETR